MVNCFLRQVPGTVHYRELGLLQFNTYDDELNYVVCFCSVRPHFLNVFEHKGTYRKATTADRIRLIGPVSLQETNLTGYIP